MVRGAGHRGELRRTGLVLVALALFMRVLIPAGYMASASPGGPALVICTGEGPLQVSVDPAQAAFEASLGHDGKPAGPEPKSDHPCAFAGAAAPLTAPSLAEAPAPLPAYPAPATVHAVHQRPGLGLAAPPPPTTGPPRLI
ncbi:MAG: hypothetical protein ACK4YQ_01170 [Phenylobacterium sp.]|uniref:hypothetical protein n=1 Tax=Phenylobacterium sp. TaxID=1871053 RepID=UPI00391A50AA